MSYNNRQQYNTRFSGRFNTPGQFVSAGEAFSQEPPRKPMQQDLPPPPLPPPLPQEDISMEQEEMNQSVTSDEGSTRPYWMKTKLMGVKKISNKERRRRQNENLRRLLTPKNALMVLNEMMPNEQVTNQFKVEPAVPNNFKATSLQSFCADLTIEGNVYKGFGGNKLMARNAAAEQAIRDLIIKKMNKITVTSDSGSANGAGDSVDEEPLPMIQLASFALHKLFSEWEYEGHVVPQLKPTGQPPAAPAAPVELPPEPAPRKPKELPATASAMHPCMLLTHMRSNLEYREVAVETGPDLKPLFTMSVEVDGVTYIGKGQNKKEGRKLAAKAACNAIFNVIFDEDRQQQMN